MTLERALVGTGAYFLSSHVVAHVQPMCFSSSLASSRINFRRSKSRPGNFVDLVFRTFTCAISRPPVDRSWIALEKAHLKDFGRSALGIIDSSSTKSVPSGPS